MKKIVVDVMGNDNGVQASVEASIEFTKINLEYIIILVGDKKEIKKYANESERIQIIDSPNVVNGDIGARAARNGDNSMAHALDLVKQGKANGMVSSGDSGAYLSMATLILKRLNNVKRPAFMPVFPTIIEDKKFVMLDVGANIDSTYDMLYQWAHIGSIFSKNVLHVPRPRVGVINVGTEETKGKYFHQEVHDMLKNDTKINFVGFVEPRELLNGIVDVAVTDGYGGNLILKSMEGSVLSLLTLMKKKLKSKLKYKVGALLAKGAFTEVKNVLDYRNVGAAWIIGLNGLVVKAHGSSDKKAFLGALKQLADAIDSNALSFFEEGIDG